MEILGLGETALLATVGGFIAGGVVKGLTGAGLPLVAVPVMATVVPVPFAVMASVIPAILTNIVQFGSGRNLLGVLHRFRWLLVCILIGTVIGASLLISVDHSKMIVALGVFVILFSLSQIVPDWVTLPPGSERWAGPIAGFVGGFLGGFVGMSGPAFVSYAVLLRLPKEEFITAIASMYMVTLCTLTASVVAAGAMGWREAAVSAAACIPAGVGLWLGTMLRARISQKTFRLLVLAMLVAVGFTLIAKGLSG